MTNSVRYKLRHRINVGEIFHQCDEASHCVTCLIDNVWNVRYSQDNVHIIKSHICGKQSHSFELRIWTLLIKAKHVKIYRKTYILKQQKFIGTKIFTIKLSILTSATRIYKFLVT